MKTHIIQTRDEKVMISAKYLLTHMQYFLAMHVRWETPSEYEQGNVHPIIIL